MSTDAEKILVKSNKGRFTYIGIIVLLLVVIATLIPGRFFSQSNPIRVPVFKVVDRAFGENAGDAPLRVCAAKAGYNPVDKAATDAEDRLDVTKGGVAGFTRGSASIDDIGKCLEGNMKPSISVGDLDGDYLPDLLMHDNVGGFWLYWNNGGVFTPAEKICFVSIELCNKGLGPRNTLSVFTDINGDSILDIAVAASSERAEMYVKFGLGNRSFKDAEVIEVLALNGNPDSSVTIDTNKDGINDIIYTVRTSFSDNLDTQVKTGENPRLVRILESTKGVAPYFVDRTIDYIPFSKRDESSRGRNEEVSENSVFPYQPFMPVVHDFDQDGELDIFLAADGGGSRMLFRDKKSKKFTDSTKDSGVYGSFAGMGATLYDFNKDGLMDIFATEITPDWSYCNHDRACDYGSIGNTIFLNQGDRTFRVSGSWDGVPNTRLGKKDFSKYFTDYDPGLRYSGWGWGFSVSDLNNDGFVDFFIGVGQSSRSRVEIDWSSSYQRPYMFLSDGQGRWVESTGGIFRALTMPGTTSMISSLDYDGDYRADLVIAGDDTRRPYLLLNRTAGGLGGLLVVKGKGLGGTALSGEGSLVKFEAGGRWDSFEVSSKNSNYRVHGSTSPIPLGFGEAKEGIVTVTFPTGKVVKKKVYAGVVNIISEF